jgi:type IV pilus assembly protein PilO
MDFSDIQDIDIADFSSWPHWFRWVVIFLVGAGLLWGGYKYFIEPEQLTLARLEREEVQLRESFLIKKEQVVNLPAYREQMVETQAAPEQDRGAGAAYRYLPDRVVARPGF